MFELDSFSLYIALVLVHIILATSILASRRAWLSPSLRLWGIAILINGAALIILAFRGVWPDLVTKTLAIFLVSTVFALCYLSIAIFFGLRHNRYWVYAPPIVAAILFSLPLDQMWRNVVSGIINGGQAIYIVWVIVRQGFTAQAGPRIMLATGAAVIGGGFFWRAIDSAWFVQQLEPTAPATDPTTLLVGLISVLVQTTAVLMMHWGHGDERLRAQRETALRLSANRTRFLAAASHDLRQPLQAMTYIVDDLRSRCRDATLTASHAKLARVTEEMKALLDSILDVARLDLGGVTPVLRATSVDDLFLRLDKDFSACVRSNGLRWKLFWPNDIYLRTDLHLLYSLVSNLVSNAIKYTERGGVMVAARRRGRRVLIQVFDTGIGISATHGDQIFEEFYQVNNPSRDRAKGIGLGLFMVRRLSELLECKIEWRSTMGRGTVFSVYLPEDVETSPPKPEPEEDTPLPVAGLRIVVLEDDKDNREALCAWLRSMQNDVQAFAAAEPAMANDGALETADFFIVDYRLSGEMTGLDFLKAAARLRRVRAVIITGSSTTATHELSGCGWPVLAKPVAPGDLLRAIHDQMAQPGNQNLHA